MQRLPLSIVLVAFFLLIHASAFPQKQLHRATVLEDGTPLKLRLLHNVSSNDARVGDQVNFEVLEEVRIGDRIVIPKSGSAWGTVTEAQGKRLVGGGGKLSLSIDNVQLANGEKAALRAVKENRRTQASGGISAESNSHGTFDAMVGKVYGKDVMLVKGTEIVAYISGDVRIAPAVEPAPPLEAAVDGGTAKLSDDPSANTVSVLVSSTPGGADIELDGSFVGSTPSIINMAPGHHTIVMRKKSFKTWERKIKAMSGSIKIEAELEADK